METAIEYFELIVQSMIAESFGMGFLVGAVLFLLGLFVLGLFLLSRFLGYRTEGRALGYVEVKTTKTRNKDGKEVQKEKTTLYPVFEYEASDGLLRQMRSSEGGTMVKGYATGQSVNLIVREDEGYDDVYDAQSFGALYLSFGLLVAGVLLMWWVGSAASAFGVTAVSGLIGILFCVSRALLGKMSQPKRSKPPKRERKPYSKSFDPQDLKPFESLHA